MLDVDTWRRNEAEARQEMPTYVCFDCGERIDECDTFICSICFHPFCVNCLGDSDSMCPDCKETYESEAEE